MAFELRIQDPNAADATLLELLLECTENASHGAGVFSFASTGGAKLLFEDTIFSKFIARNKFELIVGVDAITVPATLNFLQSAETAYRKLSVRVFFHRQPNVLFHPKFCWFASRNHARILVGSGNLTRNGFLRNWEAFSDTRLPKREQTRLSKNWVSWRAANAALLRPAEDPEVIARAKKNETSRRQRHEEDDTDLATTTPENASVLLAEIPRGSTRWNQANFDIATFTQFFDLKPSIYRRVVLFPVRRDGTIGEPELRPGVSIRSRNYRIELGQASGLPYPENGRPIGLFLKIGPRRFRYRMLMPGGAEHAAASAFLDQHRSSPANRLAREIMSLATFKAVFPSMSI